MQPGGMWFGDPWHIYIVFSNATAGASHVT